MYCYLGDWLTPAIGSHSLSLSDSRAPTLFFRVLSFFQISSSLSFKEVLRPRLAHLFTLHLGETTFIFVNFSRLKGPVPSEQEFKQVFFFVFFFNKTLLMIPICSGCPGSKWPRLWPRKAWPSAFSLATISRPEGPAPVSISYMSDCGTVSFGLFILLDTNFVCPVFWRKIEIARGLSLLISQ